MDAKVDAKLDSGVDEQVYVNVDIEGATKMDAKEVNRKKVDEKEVVGCKS